jgi:hypothetical protein
MEDALFKVTYLVSCIAAALVGGGGTYGAISAVSDKIGRETDSLNRLPLTAQLQKLDNKQAFLWCSRDTKRDLTASAFSNDTPAFPTTGPDRSSLISALQAGKCKLELKFGD